MTNLKTIDNTKFTNLSATEMMETEGGAILTATVAGIAVWKIVGGVGVVGAGIGAGYLINK